MLHRYKCWLENQCNVRAWIYEMAEKAINYYQKTSKCRRTIYMITRHISEILSSDGNIKQAKKYRYQIAKSLINEGWLEDAVIFLEKAKNDSIELNNIGDVFAYEMEILNYKCDES